MVKYYLAISKQGQTAMSRTGFKSPGMIIKKLNSNAGKAEIKKTGWTGGRIAIVSK